jgi:hypothetical protein
MSPPAQPVEVSPRSLVSDPVVVVALLLVGGWAYLWYDITIDDTYIVLRYAHNLAVGEGPVFNVAERVEGYSCPLWVFGLGFIQWLGGDTLWAAKWIGITCAIGLVLLLHASLRRLVGRRFSVGLATLGFALIPSIHVYAGSGMDTIPFAFAIALSLALPILSGSRWLIRLGLPLLLVCVATLRPEGLMVALALALFWLVRGDGGLRAGIVGAAALLVLLLVLRHGYYDAWLPNTYLAKPSPLLHEVSDAFRSEGIWSAAARWLSLLSPAALAMLAAFAVLLGCFASLGAQGEQQLIVSLTPTLIAAGVGVVFLGYAPPDWMPVHRFALPFLFPVFLIGGVGLNSVSRAPSRRLGVLLLLPLAAWGALSIRVTALLWRDIGSGTGRNVALNARRYVEIGEWLREQGAPGDRVLAYEVGAIGYVSQLHIVDHEGLVTKEVAQVVSEVGSYGAVRSGSRPAALERIVRYCVAQRPRWFLVRSRDEAGLRLGEAVPRRVAKEAIQRWLLMELGDSMQLVRVFKLRPDRPDSYLVLKAKE